MSFRVVIPARYQSSRLPAKALLDIAGKPMVQHVYEKALLANPDSVTIATDDQRIVDAVEAFGGDCVLTSNLHESGTDRLAEVARLKEWADEEIVVNVQGDEPLIPFENIQQCASILLETPSAEMATLSSPIDDIHDYFEPNIVKVVVNHMDEAMYFSRATIPWHRDHLAVNRAVMPPLFNYSRHIGIYAYRCGFLQRFVDYGSCELERIESLEQLRALWFGHRIIVKSAAKDPGVGVDTEEDLRKVRTILARSI